MRMHTVGWIAGWSFEGRYSQAIESEWPEWIRTIDLFRVNLPHINKKEKALAAYRASLHVSNAFYR